MTDWQTDIDEDEEDEEEQQKERNRAGYEARQAKKELVRVQRENAMLRAGINLESNPGQLVAKAYDGELTPEAIRKFAADIPGALLEPPKVEEPEPQPEPKPEVPAAEVAFSAERERLATGSPPDTGISEDPSTVALRESEEILRSGATREDALAHFVAKQARAAMEGDERAIVSKPRTVVG